MSLIDAQLEYVNIPQEDIQKVHELRINQREIYESCIKDVLVPAEQVDQRVTNFVSVMNNVNTTRAHAYKRDYEQPTIFYVDSVKAYIARDQINDTLKKVGIENCPLILDSGNVFSSFGNFIVVYVNRFDDADIDAYRAIASLRHEMSHAGSVIKIRAYPSDNKDEVIPLRSYRMGGHVQNLTEEVKGACFDEGHHKNEDDLFKGFSTSIKGDYFLSMIPTAQEIIPEGVLKYQKLKTDTIENGETTNDKDLFIYREKIDIGPIKVTESLQSVYGQLMAEIYKLDSSLYALAVDAIYGDRLIPFAQALDKFFGKGFFQVLMNISTESQAVEVLKNISIAKS